MNKYIIQVLLRLLGWRPKPYQAIIFAISLLVVVIFAFLFLLSFNPQSNVCRLKTCKVKHKKEQENQIGFTFKKIGIRLCIQLCFCCCIYQSPLYNIYYVNSCCCYCQLTPLHYCSSCLHLVVIIKILMLWWIGVLFVLVVFEK